MVISTEEKKNRRFFSCLIKMKVPSYVKKDIKEELSFNKKMSPKKPYTETVKMVSRLYGGYYTNEQWEKCGKIIIDK